MRESKMLLSTLFCLISYIHSFPLSQIPDSAAKEIYIVYMGVHSHKVEDNTTTTVENLHHGLLGSVLGSTEKAKEAIIHSYTGDINGFSAIFNEDEAARVARLPKVVSVFLDRSKILHTTHSWEFMQMEKDGEVPKNSIWKKARYGEGVIIANLDTGVWPESKSFSDEGFGPIPSKWKGFCQNDTEDGVSCNRKLIGARYFHKFASFKGREFNASTRSARDYNGHGTQTLSIAAGNFVRGANIMGLLNGTAKGGSPKARAAAYKVCWRATSSAKDQRCYDGDILSGFETAIGDGVDVLSVSLGGKARPYFNDSISIGAFHAVKKGIVVVCAAGNVGRPGQPGHVQNVAPWIITVAASTMDREIETYAKLGNGHRFQGTGISKPLPSDRPYPLISSELAQATGGGIDPEKVKGKILVCQRGPLGGFEEGRQAALAGAVGMILCRNSPSRTQYHIPFLKEQTFWDEHILPAVNVNSTVSYPIYDYINTAKQPTAYISPTTIRLKSEPAPVIDVIWSSSGPNAITRDILKPDITAPGVNVIAAFTEAVSPTGKDSDTRRSSFALDSGSSMSCAHVSGIVGLLKRLHPTWSPAAIKSAIMTTATTTDNAGNPIHRSIDDKATPLDYGAGHIRPHLAMDPGLVYDLSANDYLYFLCAVGYEESKIQLISAEPYKCPENASLLNFNYPSITVNNITKTVTVTRKLKNVGSPGIYKAQIRQPPRFFISVRPNVLKFDEIGEEKSFELTIENETGRRFSSSDSSFPNHYFGELVWSDGHHQVMSPVVVT